MEPLAGVPPTGGGWEEYQAFSAQLTTGLAPCSRAHSANRAETEVPRLGLVSALSSETQTGMRPTAMATNAIRNG